MIVKIIRMTLISVILITVMIGIKSIINRHTEISEDSKKNLLELLEIEDALSFKFIHRKKVKYDAPFHCCELKFEISKQDYEENELKYGESYLELEFDCNYIEKEENDIYTCVVRRTDQYNKEFYTKLGNIKIQYDK